MSYLPTIRALQQQLTQPQVAPPPLHINKTIHDRLLFQSLHPQSTNQRLSMPILQPITGITPPPVSVPVTPTPPSYPRNTITHPPLTLIRNHTTLLIKPSIYITLTRGVGRGIIQGGMIEIVKQVGGRVPAPPPREILQVWNN